MELRPEFVLPVLAKTLRDIVLPALDKDHEVAQDQTRLAIAFLEVLDAQFAVLPLYDADELNRYIDFARKVRAAIASHVPDEAALIDDALGMAGACEGSAAHAVDTTRALRSAINAAIDAAHMLDDEGLSVKVHRIVLDFSSIQLQRERAMAKLMGFEAGAAPIPEISEQLSTAVA